MLELPQDNYDCIVIGAASAGLTAALYLARQAASTLVISKDIGGQALLTDDIENYPGFAQISGFELMNKFQQQAAAYGAEFVYDEVTEVGKLQNGNFSVKTRNQEYVSTALILAFGKTPRNLDVPGEEAFKGRGVSYCAVCDGPLYKKQPIAVVGIGEHVLQAAVYLSGIASKLYVVYKGSRISQDDELYQQLRDKENVEFLINYSVEKIEGEMTVNTVSIKSNAKENPDSRELKVEGLFVEMGYVARTDFVKGLVELTKNNEIITDKLGLTSQEGVFVAGDVTDIPFKQAVISAGQGSSAALSAYNYIQKKLGKTAVRSDWKSVKVEAKPPQ